MAIERTGMTQDEAEKLVAGILQRFEESSGDLVESVEIRNVEITRIDDTRPRWMTQVVIRTQRTPGRDWVIDHEAGLPKQF